MKPRWTLALLTGLLGCLWKDNPDWIGSTDQSGMPADLTPPPPDLMACPVWPSYGGGGKNRPQVLLPAGTATIAGVQAPVAGFAMDVFPVTVGAYRDCVMANACTAPATTVFCNWTTAAGTSEGQPINCVSWSQASAFCTWAERRLPMEEEWQYAAGRSPYVWGGDDPIATGTAGAQSCWSTNDGTCKVGSYPATLFGSRNCGGLEDLSGNVAEWTSSEYDQTYTDPAPPCAPNSSSCSVRGVPWIATSAAAVRASVRSGASPATQVNTIGFRCAKAP